MRLILAFSLLFIMSSCEQDVFETDDFKGTWTVDWIRCDNFHNKAVGQMSFTMTDTTVNTGQIQETIFDTLRTYNFHFEFISNEKLLIDTLFGFDSTYTSYWLGSHTISELQESSFLLERGVTACDDELFKFTK
jgi:hypothetical protein